MKDKEFNLLHEPWIAAIRPDGVTEEVSLLELYQRTTEFRSLAGELPTQDVAVLRLLLAILHAVFSRYDTDGKFAPISSPKGALERWKALWDWGAFPMEIIRDYLLLYEERFYLFHPERPFYQANALRDRDDVFGPFAASKLNGELSESDHKLRLFPQRSGEGKSSLRYAEAARWLLYINGFSETFGKLEAKGKKSKKAPSLGVGWLGKLGLIYAEGDTLYETLLLNLVMLRDGENILWGKEKPVWELEKPVTEERNEIALPDNPSQLLTLQSRRLLLVNENGRVTNYRLLSGDFFLRENAFAEQMTVWRNTAKRATDLPEYIPRRHDPARQLWRDFSALVSQSASARPPGIVKWIARLKSERLAPLFRIRFRIAAVSYGTMEAVIEDTFSDSLSFNAGLLTSLGENWASRIITEIDTTEQLVEQVGILAQNLAKAAGSSDSANQRNAAKEQAYFLLDEPFRAWLENIVPERDDDRKEEICSEWWEQAKRIVQDMGRDMVRQAGTKAFIGRDVIDKVRGNAVTRHYSAPDSFNYFLYKTSCPDALKGGKGKNG